MSHATTRGVPGTARWLLCGAFFVSGVAALAFENLWFHQAGLAFGNSVWAASIVLAAFMAGIALGAALAARIGERLAAPIRTFAVLELLVAASGIALVYGLPALTQFLATSSDLLVSQLWLLTGLRFVCAFGLLLLPCTAMGMTLPLLVRGMRMWNANIGPALGLLYGANTLGAVAGVLWTELYLLQSLGVRGSSLAAASCNVLAAGLGWLAARDRQPLTEPGPRLEATPWTGMRWLIATFSSGFAMLGLELVWLRCMTLFLNDTPLAFAIILAGTLLGIALGSFSAAAWLARRERAADYAGWVALGAGLLGSAAYRGYASVLQFGYQPDQGALAIAAVAWPLIVPTALMSGALFSLLGAGLAREVPSAASSTGRLAFVNTLGAGLGSLGAGFVLIPNLGMERTLFTLLACFMGTGLMLIVRVPNGNAPKFAALAISALGLGVFPFGAMQNTYLKASAQRFMRPSDRIVSVKEGVTGTLVHVAHYDHELALFDHLATNAYAMTANDFAARRYMRLFVALPAAVHPHIQRALVVGYGIGNTAAALTDLPELQRLDIADISRDILNISRHMRTGPVHNPLDDARTRVHIEDGRLFLAGTSERYDLITGEPPPPTIAGVVNLYTREYFQLVHDRLLPRGMATHWLPLMNLSASGAKAIIRGFCAAFTDCSLWHGSVRNFILFGTRAATGPVEAAQFRQPWMLPNHESELANIGVELPEQLGALFIGDASYLDTLTRESNPLTDDDPKQIHAPGPREERDALIWQWRDTAKARERFVTSPLIARLWPQELRAQTVRQFENQRLLNDLLFPEPTQARQMQVLHQVLQHTRLRFPVLLLLNSDPDVQARLALAPQAVRERPEWRMHRAAGLLADRDFRGALAMLEGVSQAALPFADLPDYMAFALQRSASREAQ